MAEAIEEQVETAEEAGDTEKLLNLLESCNQNGGDGDWSAATEACLDAYYRLVKADPASKKTETVLSTLISCLQAWREEEAIVEVALGCIVGTTPQSPSNNDKLSKEAAVLLVDIMKSYPDEGTIQEQASLAVEGMATADKVFQETFLQNNGKEELAAAKNTRITNERNKSYPERAAKALGITL